MLRQADRAVVIEPKSPQLAALPGVTVVDHFDELSALITDSSEAA
jgi:hypothetical protein